MTSIMVPRSPALPPPRVSAVQIGRRQVGVGRCSGCSGHCTNCTITSAGDEAAPELFGCIMLPQAPAFPAPKLFTPRGHRVLMQRATHLQQVRQAAVDKQRAEEASKYSLVDATVEDDIDDCTESIPLLVALLNHRELHSAIGSNLCDDLFVHVFGWLPVSSFPMTKRVSTNFYIVLHSLLAWKPTLQVRLQLHLDALSLSQDPRVWVAVRVRPHEQAGCLELCRNRVAVKAREGRHEDGNTFFFDAAFDASTTQIDVWSRIHPPLMRCLLRGEHACVLAYGQTGSGKTHTMFGSPGTPEDAGIAYRVAQSLARLVDVANMRSRPIVEFSFLEIYNEKLRDLLAERQTEGSPEAVLQPHNAFQQGLVRKRCNLKRMQRQLSTWLHVGMTNRAAGKTVLNSSSSRSHAVATLHIRWQLVGSEEERETRLYLVDLAGSERAGQCALSAEQLKEGVNINKSLTTLARVVGTLARGRGEHVPYRDSMLTWLLSDAITGRKARAFMIATLHPGHPAETMSTLRYAQQYSALRSDLSGRISRLVSEVRAMQNRLDRVKSEFKQACQELQQSRGGQWCAETLDDQAVRSKHGVKAFFKGHPLLRWTQAHWNKRSIGAVGHVCDVAEAPPPRNKGEQPDGRRIKPRHDADGEREHGRVMQVCYPGKHGHPSTMLWYPEAALLDVAPPLHLQELLKLQIDIASLVAQKRTQLLEARELFMAQQQCWMETA